MLMFIDIPIILASLGIVLAATSFISGLQLVKGKSVSIEGKIHRANGYITIGLFLILTAMAIAGGRINAKPLLAPLVGLAIFLLKLWIIRRKKRFFKYVSWMGGSLIIVWLFIFYIHVPA